MEFTNDKAVEHSTVEPFSTFSCQLEPAGHRAPSHSFDSSSGRNAHAMYAQVDDLIEQRSGFMQPVVRCAVGRTERTSTFLAAEAPTFTLCGGIERVANDVALVELTFQGATGVRTSARSSSALLHTCVITENASKIQ